MASQSLSYQELLQLVELIKSSSQFREFRFRSGDFELELRRGLPDTASDRNQHNVFAVVFRRPHFNQQGLPLLMNRQQAALRLGVLQNGRVWRSSRFRVLSGRERRQADECGCKREAGKHETMHGEFLDCRNGFLVAR